MNCRGDDDVDAKRSRPSIGKTPLSATRGKNACFWLGLDQRITSGPAAIAAALKGRIHGCTRTLRRTSDSSCIAGAVHTWHLATDCSLIANGRFRSKADVRRRLALTGCAASDPSLHLAANFAVTHNAALW